MSESAAFGSFERPSVATRLVLLIDDDYSVRTNYRRFLELQFGTAVIEANGTDEALQVIEHESLDLIILDLCLPNLHNGIVLLRALKQASKTRHIPVVVVTGFGTNSGQEKAVLSLGADGFFLKTHVSLSGDSTFLRRLNELMHLDPAPRREASPNGGGATILVVDEEKSNAELIQHLFARDRVKVIHATSGRRGLDVASRTPPDIVVVDLKLTGMSAENLCRQLRRPGRSSYIPILVMTSERRVQLQPHTCESIGADDYFVKGGSPEVLLARIKRLIRGERLRLDGHGRLSTGGSVISGPDRAVTVLGERTQLTRQETALLALLMGARGHTLSAKRLYHKTHGHWPRTRSAAIKMHISNIRNKFGKHGRLIESCLDGYRFNVEYAESLIDPTQTPPSANER